MSISSGQTMAFWKSQQNTWCTVTKVQDLSSEAAERYAASDQEGGWEGDRVRKRNGIWFWDGDSDGMWDNYWDRYGTRDCHWVGSRNRNCHRMRDSYWVQFRDGHWVMLRNSHRDVTVKRNWDRLRDGDWEGHTEGFEKMPSTSGLTIASAEPGDRNVLSVTYDRLNDCGSVSCITATPSWIMSIF